MCDDTHLLDKEEANLKAHPTKNKLDKDNAKLAEVTTFMYS